MTEQLEERVGILERKMDETIRFINMMLQDENDRLKKKNDKLQREIAAMEETR
jgi:FtsZ-binding cell division protein ZapB